MFETEAIPLSLYVHLPWCIRKCPYCDFNSHEASPDGLPEQAYLDALSRDLEAALPLVWGRRVVSIFIGGGTPNLFAPEAIDQLLQRIRALLPLMPDLEVTLEANPGARLKGQFQGLRQAGVTRLSLGVQSFDDQKLQALGRVHQPDQALQAAHDAVSVFDRVNLDLMYALPGQTLAQAQADLATALSVNPGHVSLYQLTLEPNTYFAKFPPQLPDEERVGEMQDVLLEQLGHAGYERYEVSAYARPGHRCQHNLNYWQFGDYLGIGAGAHSKLTLPERGVVRQTCLRRPEDFLQASPDRIRQTQPVPSEALDFEFMLNALRLVDGFQAEAYRSRTGRPLESVLPGLQRGMALGLLASHPGGWHPTTRGLDLLNDLQMLFLHD